MKSLDVDGYVAYEVLGRRRVELTEEGEDYATNGSAEFQYTSALQMGKETLETDLKLNANILKVGF